MKKIAVVVEQLKADAQLIQDTRTANAPTKFDKLVAEDVPATLDELNRAEVDIDGVKIRASLKRGVSAIGKTLWKLERFIAVRPFEVSGNKFPAGYPSYKLS